MRELEADVIVLGGGTAGFAAAIGAARLGKKVIVTEETDWLGGQLTSQAVPPTSTPGSRNSAAPSATAGFARACASVCGIISR